LRSIHFLALLVLGALAVLPAGEAEGFSSDPWRSVRERVVAAARPAYLRWLGSLAPDRAREFGFRSLDEARQAEILLPIPYYVPDRSGDALTRGQIETLVESPSSTWLVPVAVEGRVVALVTMGTQASQEPEAIEFGKPWAANRLEAGFRRLEKDGRRRGADVRFIAFFSPNMDVLLVRPKGDRGWLWLELSGTAAGNAEVLDAAEIETRLARIRDAGLRDEP
jgi:hypothetical protein